jgi:phosphohistidine phosphatase
MKTLYLLRHAKSSWDKPGLSDRERPLNKRGKRDAPRMGAALRDLVAAQVIAASPARRAQLTLGGLCDGWPELAALQHRTEEGLYTFDVADLLQWLRRQDDAEDPLFILGHNPALTDLINLLAPADYLPNLPTAGFVELALELEHWRDITGGSGSLVRALFPRQL